MTELERLARETSDLLWGNDEREDPPANLAVNAYIAGFRRARAMALGLGLEDCDHRYIREQLEQLGEREA